jgi:hypothetical protein
MSRYLLPTPSLQAVVVQCLQGREVAVVLVPGAIRSRAGITDRVVDQVHDRPSPRRDVVRRSVHDIAVGQGDRRIAELRGQLSGLGK